MENKSIKINKQYIVLDWKTIKTIRVFQLEKSPGFYIENPISKKLMRLVGITENDEFNPV